MVELIVWGALMIALILVETATAQLVSIWFAVGSLAAFIVSIFTDSVKIQITVFLSVSIILLAATRPIVKKFVRVKHQATNADAVITQQGIVTEAIDNLKNQGRILVNGLSWNARSSDNLPIQEGCKVSVVRIEGVTAFVRMIPPDTVLIKTES